MKPNQYRIINVKLKYFTLAEIRYDENLTVEVFNIEKVFRKSIIIELIEICHQENDLIIYKILYKGNTRYLISTKFSPINFIFANHLKLIDFSKKL